MRLQLQPGSGLGPFRLGAPLPEVLSLVRQQAAAFPCVELKYAAQGGAGDDIALSFPEQGLHLLFDGRQQRLRLIDVHDTTRLQVCYGGHVFGGAAHAPAFGRVCEAFGPTYPADPEEVAGGAERYYPLQYPGLLFLFPLADASNGKAGGGGGGGAAAARAPPSMSSSFIGGIEFPVALSTRAARILVHQRAASGGLAAARAAPPPLPPPGSRCGQGVEAAPGQGLLLGGSGAALRFGDSPQDVVCELGEPACARPKPPRPPGALGGGPGGGSGNSTHQAPDYFFCYPERGLDVLFCGGTHRAIKFVLHANEPGHAGFGLYAKCLFRVHPPGSWSLPGATSGAEEAGDSPHAYTSASAGSEGAASMKTAASGSSLAAVEAAAAQRQAAEAGCAAGEPAAAAAAADMLVSAGGAPLEDGAANGIGGSSSSSSQAQAAAAAAALGRPPRPPSLGSSAPIPTPPPGGKGLSGASKKKRKKERQRAAAAAKLLGAAGSPSGGGGEEWGSDADDTDTSCTGSAPSSLASSPGMTSFLSNIAATGGAGGRAPAAAAGAAGGQPSGASSEAGSAADLLAGRERRLECGSAFDGWSEAEDLALLVGGEEAQLPPLPPPPRAGARGAAPAAPGSDGFGLPLPPPLPQEQQQQASRLRVSSGVQTLPVPESELAPAGDGGADLAAPGSGPDSPDSFVLADSPALFDESTAAAGYESIPRQRSSGTQTQPHLLAAAAQLRPGGGSAAGSLRRSGASAAAAAGASAAAVGVDARLPDILAAFGAGARPALHTRGRHPFGPTHLYAYRGVVFEVLKSGAIATVTLFEA